MTAANSLGNPHRLAEAVKQHARQLGFSLVGITTPDPPPHFDTFTAWLQAGRHGEMAYLASERSRQRRGDPRQILPECRAILVLGIPYSTLRKDRPDDGGRVAAYAWGADYHDVLPVRLKALVTFLEEQVNQPIPNRWYTDSGPLLERDLAQRAGLGWIGKNTCLIHPRQGSYFLLAEILLGIELEADSPFTSDHCGTCTRCLEACPTACILPDRTLDARRCLSYLTIELKGSIPLDLRPLLGSWVFGCDICQQVCPWNQRFAQAVGDAAFAALPGVPPDDLTQEIRLSDQEFKSKFRGSPVKRTKRRGYLRNVATALGNLQNPAAISNLAQALLTDTESLVRSHAAWALGQIGGPAADDALLAAAQHETDLKTRAEIQQAAGLI